MNGWLIGYDIKIGIIKNQSQTMMSFVSKRFNFRLVFTAILSLSNLQTLGYGRNLILIYSYI